MTIFLETKSLSMTLRIADFKSHEEKNADTKPCKRIIKFKSSLKLKSLWSLQTSAPWKIIIGVEIINR